MNKLAVMLLALVIAALAVVFINSRISRAPANVPRPSNAAPTILTDSNGNTFYLGGFKLNGTNVPATNVTVRTVNP